MALIESIASILNEKADLDSGLSELYLKDRNKLTTEDKSLIDADLTDHFGRYREVVTQVYYASKKAERDNKQAWNYTIVSDGNRRGHMCELDDMVLGIVRVPEFDAGEAERLLDRRAHRVSAGDRHERQDHPAAARQLPGVGVAPVRLAPRGEVAADDDSRQRVALHGRRRLGA